MKELEEHNAAALWIEELERENKRLFEALEESRKEKNIQDTATPKPPSHTRNASNPVPTSSEASTEKKMEGEGERVVKYNKLVEKFNDLYKTKNYAVEAKNDLVEKQRQKDKKYAAHVEELRQVIVRRDARIQKQKGTITDCRKRLGLPDLPKRANKAISGITSDAETDVPASPKEPAQPDNAPEQSAAPLKEKPAIEGSSKAPGGPIVNQKEFPTPFEPLDPTYYPSPTGVPSSLPAQSQELPPNLLREGRFHVEDTQFEPIETIEPIEAEHFGSTQDDPSQHSSPQRPGVEDKGENTPRVEIPETPESPVVVSSRTIKKRKRPSDNADQSTPKAVKVETINSSPILASLRQLTHTDSFDLDEIGEKVNTPKKRRMLELSRKASRLSATSQANASLGEHDLRNSTNTPLSQHIAGVEQSEDVEAGSPLQPLNPNRLLLPRTSNLDPKSPKRRRVVSDKAVASLGEDESRSDSSGNKVRIPSNNDGRLNNLLTNPSPPKRDLHVNHSVDPRTPNQQRSPQLSIIELPSELAKSRQHNLEPPGMSSRNPSPARPSSEGGMGRRPAQPPGGRDATPVTASRPARRIPNSEAPRSRTPPVGAARRSVESAPRTRMRRTDNLRPQSRQQRVSHENDDEAPGDYGPEPLRSRPLDKLEPGDFVINSNHNQGLGFAFNDVVRGKEKRRCLQGCTKPECCGNAFRTFIQMTNDNRGPPTMSQEEADEKLLEEFLGDNAHKIQNMSRDERDELLLQAKTRELANTSGKHRYVHERRRSPVGFWQTDFPSTQEHAEQLEAARVAKREEVEKRYAQAMRPGAMWKFRDE